MAQLDLTQYQRLGYYQVGEQIVFNKANALIEASKSNQPIRWIFNDSTYSKYNWCTPISESLPELYKRRAQQLRDQYDHLMLYYSGGADSTNVLHAFVDNNIFLDEIVMQYPSPVESSMNDKDTDNNNYFSEIKYAAVPHLQKIAARIHPKTRIRFLDQYQDTVDLYADEYWFERYPLGTMITPAAAGRQISAIKDPMLTKLFDAGCTVCQIFGVDKPLVTIGPNGQYYAYFRDANATHAIPTGFELGELASKYFNLEFFYWTPDLPEIVIKQAQEIKTTAQYNQKILSCLSGSTRIELFRELIHPIIYCHEANIRVFQTDKPKSNVFRPMDKWFWLPEFKQAQDNYLQVIKHLEQNVSLEYAQDGSIYNGIKAIDSRYYPL